MKKWLMAALLALVSFTPLHSQPHPHRIAVTLYGSVNDASAHDVITAIQAANALDPSAAPILFYIDSGGGSILAGGKIIDAMAASRKPIWTVNVGMAASMAAIIHTYGTRRLVFPHSLMMFHDAAGDVSGSPAQMRTKLVAMTRFIADFEKHVAHVAGLSLAEYRAKESENWYLLAADAVSAHMADEIVNSGDYPPPGERQPGLPEQQEKK